MLVACSMAGGRPSPELRAAMTAARCARGADGVRTHILVVNLVYVEDLNLCVGAQTLPSTKFRGVASLAGPL